MFDDAYYMKYALQLAYRGCGKVSPNPMVGAVIVKNGTIIGEGWHERYGEAHAERNALSKCCESPKGATMYVTLEPCCHQGKQPPCVEAIIEAGIKKVVVGALDANPLVAGKGIKILKEHNIEVVENVLNDECLEINEIFFHYIKTGLPFVAMKTAMTLDGKIATYSGKSKWITGEEARADVHRLRNQYTGIMVGVGTVIADDPMLNCRMDNATDPIRIICDTQLRTPLASQIVKTAKEIPTIIATSEKDTEKWFAYENMGCRVLYVEKADEHIDLEKLMILLGNEKIDSILLEGGGTLNWNALKSGIVKKVYSYIAPKMFGGEMAKTCVEGKGIESPQEAAEMKIRNIVSIGEDIRIESEVL